MQLIFVSFLPSSSVVILNVMQVQVVLLGSAPDPRIQNDFVGLANQLHNMHSDQARLCLTYDEPLSHLVSSLDTLDKCASFIVPN